MKFSRIASLVALLVPIAACAPLQSKPQLAPVPPQRAKNVILFIGDGMGISTVTAARIYDGQSRGETGEENLLSFEHFPNVALVKTYNTNQQVPDSAGTATAMNTGIKTRAGVIGVGPAPQLGDCSASLGSTLPNIAQRAHMEGKVVGIVSTMRLTHATPAAVYAHAPDRDWEADSDIPVAERGKGCKDIAAQLVEFPFDIALGGGRARFIGSGMGGKRLDAQEDLTSQWRQRSGGQVVRTRDELDQARDSRRPILGLFAESHMAYMLERKANTTEPTLTEMAVAAIDHAKRDPDGYFMMIEGGNIDHGHHEGRADIALSETQEFSRAIAAVLSKIDLENTLVLVTADHSHVFTIAGYTVRGNPILGLAMGVDDRGDPTGKPILAADGKPYSTLGYQNGPGAVQAWPRPAPSNDPHEMKQALIPTGNMFGGEARLSETHGGEDVALYANGPGAENARGVIEQNRIYDIIMRAFGFSR